MVVTEFELLAMDKETGERVVFQFSDMYVSAFGEIKIEDMEKSLTVKGGAMHPDIQIELHSLGRGRPVVAIKDMSSGNDSVGDMWQETKVLQSNQPIEDIMQWAFSGKAYSDKRLTITLPDPR
jgi:hypothetical protein